MSINITAKNDYSYLFSGLSATRNGSGTNLNFLSDYASIKNGSYYKLMKAYYGKNASDEVSDLAGKTNSTSADTNKTLAKVQSATDSLKESADALLATGKKSVFTEDKVTDKVYDAVAQFVEDYNATLSAADDVNSTSILSRTLNMTNATASNKNMLEKVGITIGTDNSLKMDKDAFMKADITTVKNLFNGTGSYAYRVSAQSSLINFAADNEAMKANTYNFTGAYNNTYSAGSIYNSFF